ncbi:MAG: hypothetical protein D3903_02750 [Candidatus Electrothrix sp. GM3_4]|nr:hypothetical protein [Candidatus Electrothrix sp. GM3_4]
MSEDFFARTKGKILLALTQATGKRIVKISAFLRRYQLNAFVKVIIIVSLFIISGCFLIACGDPAINMNYVNFKKVSIDSMISTDYLIGQGDELEISYYIEPGSAQTQYVIDTEDNLRIEFYSYPELNKNARVRPDGFITLSRVGDVKAVEMTPKALAKKVTNLYGAFLSRPQATVELIDFNVKIKKLKDAVKTTTRGQAKQVTVRPDGKISLPYLRDIMANNFTCIGLSKAVEQKYRKFVKNISITVSILKARSNKVYIMGEVNRPNFYELAGPTTLTQMIAIAGGFSNNANSKQIVLIRRGKEGNPDARLVDVDKVIGRGDMNSDPVVRQYDVIFVPKTKLSQAVLLVNSLLSLIPVRFSASYSLGGRTVE